MKGNNSLLLLIYFAISCGSRSSMENPKSTESSSNRILMDTVKNEAVEVKSRSVFEISDTTINGVKLELEEISENRYEQLKKDCMSDHGLHIDTNIKKLNGSICFSIRNKKSACFKDYKADGDDVDQVIYSYKGTLLNRYTIIAKAMYETGDFLIVDRETGVSLSTWSIPVPNQRGTFLLSNSNNYAFDMLQNGILIHGISKNGLSKYIEWIMDEAKPMEVCWIEDGCLLMKRIFLDRNYKDYKTDYLVVRIPTL